MVKIIDRNNIIVQLYMSGKTLQHIGEMYDISRERVRQVLKKNGVNKQMGGKSVSLEIDRKRKSYELNKWLPNYRCTKKQFEEINKGRVVKCGSGSIAYAYHQQKHNAQRRGIPFKLSFPEWWQIWAESGKYENRGVSMGGYCMARNMDLGAYEVGNVSIISQSDNHKDAWKYKRWNSRKNTKIKEICPKGHKKEGVALNGVRYCKICMRDSYKRYIAKKKACTLK